MTFSRADRIALLFSLIAVLAGFWVAAHIFEAMPHLEDEFAYTWQAEVIASGRLTIDSPAYPHSFLVPFVVDYHGRRFGKYPLGWPVVLSFGTRWGLRSWVNPLLAGLGIWLTYAFAKKFFNETVGLLAAGLMLTSPFFLMNSGSLLSHPWGLVLTAGFALAWTDAFGKRKMTAGWLPVITAGSCLGVLALSRPWTMVGVALPFGIHGIILLVKGSKRVRRRVLVVGMIALLLGSLHFVWQYALTGDPLLNPYTLWWKYDKVGFGKGFGVVPEGHNLKLAWINTKNSLLFGAEDLFGWWQISWLFLPVGLWTIRKRRDLWPAAGVFPSLVVVYMAYWVGAWLYGPRYYYEALFILAVLSAAGIARLAGCHFEPGAESKQSGKWEKIRAFSVALAVAVLVGSNLLFYLPKRLGKMRSLYTIHRSMLDPFLTPQAQALTPAVVFVKTKHWMPYGALLELSDPDLDTPFIFTFGDLHAREIIALHPERRAFWYYPDEPYVFYTAPKPIKKTK